MHVSVNGVRLFFDVEGAKFVPDGPVDAGKADPADASWRPRLRPFDLPAGLLRLGRYRPDRLSRPSRQRPQRGRPAGGLESGAMGRRRARVLRRARHRRSDRARRLVRRHGRAGLRHAPSGPPFQADPDQHRSRRRLLSRAARGAVRALRRPGSRRAGAPRFLDADRPSRIRPRSTPGGRLAMPHLLPRRRATRTWRAAPSAGRRCCNGSRSPAARATASTCSPICIASSARRWCSAAKTIRCTRSRARPISQPRCRPHLVQFERFADCGHAVVPDAPERAWR